jgi:hypothetical protein
LSSGRRPGHRVKADRFAPKKLKLVGEGQAYREISRHELIDHWRDAKSWIMPPVAVSSDLFGGGAGLELLIGYTRLGNLLALLDREEVGETKRHLVWVGRVGRVD